MLRMRMTVGSRPSAPLVSAAALSWIYAPGSSYRATLSGMMIEQYPKFQAMVGVKIGFIVDGIRQRLREQTRPTEPTTGRDRPSSGHPMSTKSWAAQFELHVYLTICSPHRVTEVSLGRSDLTFTSSDIHFCQQGAAGLA
jgi:hypothetical protein